MFNDEYAELFYKRKVYPDPKEMSEISDTGSTIFGGIAAGLSKFSNPVTEALSLLSEGFSMLLDFNKQLFAIEAGNFDPGSAIVDVVGATIPVPNKVGDFILDEAVDKGYGALMNIE